MVPIISKIVARSKYPLKCPYPMTPGCVVIHNTANDAPAANEIAYMSNNDAEVSFHYAVDDREIVQGIEETRNAWHCGDGNGPGNRTGIAIEICYSKGGGERFDKAERNAAELAASILNRYGWGIDKLKKHQDFNGKYCPHRTLDKGWDRFVNMVRGYMDTVDKPVSKPESKPKPSPQPAKDKAPDVVYRVRCGGTWLPEVKNLTDYAGIIGEPVTDVAVKVSDGTVKYRVHVKGAGWLPYVTGYNVKDHVHGYAGNGKEIDAVEVYYFTPKGKAVRKAKYRVSPLKGGYWPWQYDNEKTGGQDGYAGAFGKTIDRLQIVIE